MSPCNYYLTRLLMLQDRARDRAQFGLYVDPLQRESYRRLLFNIFRPLLGFFALAVLPVLRAWVESKALF